MADYWKSTGKRFCDFCKCWTADNKASIDFHEKGKNHQNNVKKRLAEIKRDSIQKRKKDEESKKMFEKMEKAALAAAQKDVNSQSVSVGKSDLRNIVKAHTNTESGESSDSTYPWQAMTAPQGITYYYNSLTGESTWQIPEVFKKLEEKKRIEKEYVVRKKEEKKSKKDVKKAKSNEEVEEKPEEIRNIHPLLGGWSTVRTYDSPDDKPSSSNRGISSNDDTNKADESTDTVAGNDHDKNEKEQQLQHEESRETGKKFKERMLKTNIANSSDEPVAFKKRKSGNRNVRKRNDDD